MQYYGLWVKAGKIQGFAYQHDCKSFYDVLKIYTDHHLLARFHYLILFGQSYLLTRTKFWIDGLSIYTMCSTDRQGSTIFLLSTGAHQSSSSSFEQSCSISCSEMYVNCIRPHALFASLQLDWATTTVDCFAPPPVYHIEMKASRKVPCPRTQQASLPACCPHYPFCAERQVGKLWIPSFEVFRYDSTWEMNPGLPTAKRTL